MKPCVVLGIRAPPQVTCRARLWLQVRLRERKDVRQFCGEGERKGQRAWAGCWCCWRRGGEKELLPPRQQRELLAAEGASQDLRPSRGLRSRIPVPIQPQGLTQEFLNRPDIRAAGGLGEQRGGGGEDEGETNSSGRLAMVLRRQGGDIWAPAVQARSRQERGEDPLEGTTEINGLPGFAALREQSPHRPPHPNPHLVRREDCSCFLLGLATARYGATSSGTQPPAITFTSLVRACSALSLLPGAA